MAKKLLKGNEAVAEAALRGGCDFFAGYPITPSTEALEYLSWRMPELGRVFIQAENEIASINMVTGAAVAGARALTATSGPGGSLMCEGFSYAARMALPYVLLNVQRWGTGLGTLDSGQTDYFKEVKGGGHGDYRSIVYTPASVQELCDVMYNAWDVAEKYMVGVVILSEAYLGQMMEQVEMPPFKERPDRGWAIDGRGLTGRGEFAKKTKGADGMKVKGEGYEQIKNDLQDWEEYGLEDAEYVIVSFGLPGRISIDAVKKLRAEGVKAGIIRPKLVWPFPEKAFAKLKGIKGLISVESSDYGQLVEDVALYAKKCGLNVPVYLYAHGKGVPGVGTVYDFYKSVAAGNEKEVF